MNHTLSPEQRDQLGRWQWRSLAVGVVALAVCVAGAFLSPGPFFRAYLISFLYFLGLAHGCFVVLMIYYLTGGAWGFLLRRILEAGMRTLPLLALLFIPVGCGVGYLYLWAQPDAVAALKTLLQRKEIYLNVPFFWGRAVLFFAIWIGLGLLLSRWSRRQDRTQDPRQAEQIGLSMGLAGGVGLVIFGITITFASVDWLMSMQPAFRSTIFGPLFAASEMLTGFACACIVLSWLLRRSDLGAVVSPDALNDIGTLLFTFLVVWTYLEFFQYMLIWIADLRYDVIWYLPRLRGGWQWLMVAVLVFGFAVPFFCLLMRPIKQTPRALAGVSWLVLLMQLLYRYWQVLPIFPETRLWEHWFDLLAPFAVGGLWLADFLWELQRQPVLASHDVNQEAALHLRRLDQHERDPEELRHA